MKFRCRKFDIQNELAALASVVDKKSKDEIYSCVRFTKFDSGTLSMTAASRELMLSTSIKLDGSATLLGGSTTTDSGQAFAVNADKLLELCKKLPDRIIEFEYDPLKLRILVRYDSSRFTLQCQEPTFFPSIRTPENYSNKVPLRFLLNSIKSSLNMISDRDESQIFHSGVLLSLEDKVLELCATDGSRLAQWFTTMETDKKFKVVLPKKTLQELSNTMDGASQTVVNLEITDNLAFLNFGRYTYQSGILVGNWPNYQLLLTAVRTSNDTFFRIPRNKLQQALERSLIFSGKKRGFAVDFAFSGKEVAITAENGQGDQAFETVEAEGSIPYLIRLNGDYVLRYLLSVPNDETVDLFVNTVEIFKPVFFRCQSDRNYIYMIQPMDKVNT